MDLKNLFDKLTGVTLGEQTEAPTKPLTVPTKPTTTPKPDKPGNPLKPTPGIEPEPKAKNRDVELFKAARSTITEMAFEPEKGKSFVDKDKKKWIESGDKELNKILPDLSSDEQSYLELVTSNFYDDMINRLEKYTGKKASSLNLPSLLSIVIQAINEISNIESDHLQDLEKLVLDAVFSLDEFEMVEDAYKNGDVEFDLKISTPSKDIKLKPENQLKKKKEKLTKAESANKELAKEFAELDEALLKRRFANMLMQGNAVLKKFLYHAVSDTLNGINPKLLNLYGIAATIDHLSYWFMPFGIEAAAHDNPDMVMGLEQVVPKGDKYVIKARGINFPFLVHETVKGIYEWVSLSEEAKPAMEYDTLSKETKDMISGPGVFKDLLSRVPADKHKLVPLIHKKLIALPSSDIKQILSKSAEGNSIFNDILKKSDEDWDAYKQSKEE